MKTLKVNKFWDYTYYKVGCNFTTLLKTFIQINEINVVLINTISSSLIEISIFLQFCCYFRRHSEYNHFESVSNPYIIEYTFAGQTKWFVKQTVVKLKILLPKFIKMDRNYGKIHLCR